MQPLMPGWSAHALCRNFSPLLLLELRSDLGRTATWFFDEDGRHLGDRIDSLPGWAHERIRERLLSGEPIPELVNALTRSRLHSFARRDTCFDPVTHSDGGLVLISPDGSRDLLRDIEGAAIEAFAPGWHARLLTSAMAPLLVLELQNQGGRASWFLGPGNRFQTNDARQLPLWARSLVREAGRRHPAEDLERDAILDLINPETRAELEALMPASARRQALERGQALANAPPHRRGAPARPRTRIWEQPTDSDSAEFAEGWVRYQDGERCAIGASSLLSISIPPCMQARLELDIARITMNRRMTLWANAELVSDNRLDCVMQEAGVRLLTWLPAASTASGRLEIRLDFQPAGRVGEPVFSLLRAHLDAVPIDDVMAPSELMMRFASLGDNCELGFVQRYFGVEPLGLMRFAGLRGPRTLIEMLEARLAGLGGPGSLWLGSQGAEYIAIERRYGLSYHTFRIIGQHDASEVLSENEVKLAYLARKFLEDVEDGEKIWVYKRVVTQDINEIQAIHAALNAIAPSRLFWITPALDGREPGSVEWMGHNLLRGYAGRIAVQNAEDFDAQIWLLLCQRAHAVFMAG